MIPVVPELVKKGYRDVKECGAWLAFI